MLDEAHELFKPKNPFFQGKFCIYIYFVVSIGFLCLLFLKKLSNIILIVIFGTFPALHLMMGMQYLIGTN